MSRVMTYREAINDALIQEMRRDSSVFVYGLDVEDHERTFGTGLGVVEEFGSDRCFSTPLSEDAMTGLGLGAAINGLRPIHTHIRVDFLTLALNQLANMISSFRFGSGGRQKVPLVIRAVIGRGFGQSYQHSKALQSIFAHLPGLKVIMPTTPNDAKGMLVAAIRDDNPVIMIEHMWLYDGVGDVSDEPLDAALDGARVLIPGEDVTVVGTSWMNVEAQKAAEILKKRGVNLEVVDARVISDTDDSVIIESVKKTGHCIVADNDWVHCGYSAEIAARVSDKCFGQLKSPVSRLGFAPTPGAYSPPLEDEFYANAVDIVRAVESKLDLSETDLSEEAFYSHTNKFRGRI